MNVLVSILLALGLLVGGGATVGAAQDDLPGEPLYQVKLLAEDVRLALNGDPQAEVEMLMEMSQERVREMNALSAAGLEPPKQVALRHESHVRQAMEVAASFHDQALVETLSRLQVSLQTQERLVEQAQGQGEPLQGTLVQVQAMLQNRLRQVEQGLADPAGFQYELQNERRFGQDEEATPVPNQQGEPGFHQNDQAPQGPGSDGGGNGQGVHGPLDTDPAIQPGSDLNMTPTPSPGKGPGPGGKDQGGRSD